MFRAIEKNESFFNGTLLLVDDNESKNWEKQKYFPGKKIN